MTILFKRVLKACLRALVIPIPRTAFRWLVDYYARNGGASESSPSFYFDRAVNYANREVEIGKAVLAGAVVFRGLSDFRHRLFEYVLREHVREPIDFIEFGVHRGTSVAWWLNQLSSGSNLYGFDSFEGLPEDWNYRMRRGEFDCNGALPDIKAPNLRFIKGWFEESLCPMLASTVLKPRLVVHMDADLYSSTIFVLRVMRDVLVPGTIAIFDEYWDVKHEYRALRDFIAETGKGFEYLAITDEQAAIRFTS